MIYKPFLKFGILIVANSNIKPFKLNFVGENFFILNKFFVSKEKDLVDIYSDIHALEEIIVYLKMFGNFIGDKSLLEEKENNAIVACLGNKKEIFVPFAVQNKKGKFVKAYISVAFKAK